MFLSQGKEWDEILGQYHWFLDVSTDAYCPQTHLGVDREDEQIMSDKQTTQSGLRRYWDTAAANW